MHMQSRSVDLDLPRARGALPRDPGLPYALALPVGVACRGRVGVCGTSSGRHAQTST